MAADLVQFLKREIEVGSFPSASYAIGSVDGMEEEQALGSAVAVPLRIRATTDTIYDCASLTKVLVTTVLVLQAVAEKKIALGDEYRGYTFREMLTHTTGLRAWLPLYALGDYLRAIEERGPEHSRGTRAVYSDLNFVLLYHAIIDLFGDYVAAARERIFEPLQLRDTCFNPPAALRPRIAATEWGQRYETGMCKEPFNGFRTGLIWGDAHDGNSFHAGGTCGNAGLFATARDVFRIAQAFARGELVPRELVEEASRVHLEDRGLGFQINETGYGHTGFTGTSVRIKGDRISVLMTNRVHPCAASIAMQRIRAEFHGANASPTP